MKPETNRKQSKSLGQVAYEAWYKHAPSIPPIQWRASLNKQRWQHAAAAVVAAARKRHALIIAALLLLALPAHAADVILRDTHPHKVGRTAYSFAIPVPPMQGLTIAIAQYNFARPTQGLAVDYECDGAGIDWQTSATGIAIAPTLYTVWDGAMQGWQVSDLADGWFRGIVYAGAPLTEVDLWLDFALPWGP